MEKNNLVKSPQKRSKGVVILGILLIINPFLYYLQLITIAIKGSIPLKVIPNFIVEKHLLALVLQLLTIMLGIGILKLKEWARKGIVFIAIVAFLLGILMFVFLFPSSLYPKLHMVLWGALLYYFFTRPKVKEQFK